MTNHTDETLRQVMATIVDVTPDPPDLPLSPPAPSEHRRRPAMVVATAFAVVLVAGGIAAVQWPSDQDSAVGGPSTTTTPPQDSSDTSAATTPGSTIPDVVSDDQSLERRDAVDFSQLRVLGSGQDTTDWKVSAFVDVDGWVCSRVSIFALAPDASPQGGMVQGCAPPDRWQIPGVLEYVGQFVTYVTPPGETPARPSLGDAIYGIVDQAVATVRVEFAGGTTVELATFGEDTGLPIRGYLYNFLSREIGAPTRISAYDAEGTLLGSYDEPVTDSPTALVVGFMNVDEPPPVIECQVPEGYPPSPNVSGLVTDSTAHPSADAALQGFLDENMIVPGTPGFAKSGYIRLIEPDGSVSFGKPFEGDESFVVTLISVGQTDSGWVVDRWEGSGC